MTIINECGASMEDGGESESFIYIVFHGENAKI
jgi:hypothetical protein